jgi:hypothetical protein
MKQEHTKNLYFEKQQNNLIKWQTIIFKCSKYNAQKKQYKVLDKYFGLQSCIKNAANT